MPSHSVEMLIEEAAAGSGRVRATMRLACGCVVTREVRDDRVLERGAAGRFVVGKEPCPVGHPVGHGRVSSG